MDKEKLVDEPIITPKRRGRPPKALGKSGMTPSSDTKVHQAPALAEDNTKQKSTDCAVRKPGRPPKSSAKISQSTTEARRPESKEEDSHILQKTPVNNASDSTGPTASANSAGRRSSRPPKPVSNKDFVVLPLSRKSHGKFEDSDSQDPVKTSGQGVNELSSPKSIDTVNFVSPSVAHGNIEPGGSQKSPGQRAPRSHLVSATKGRPCAASKEEELLVDLKQEILEQPGNESLDEASSKSEDRTQETKDNIKRKDVEGDREGEELSQGNSLNSSIQKKRGRPRKKDTEASQSTEHNPFLDHKKADAEDNSCNEREDSRNGIESPEDDSLNISSKKKRGRPRKQVVDTPQSTEEHVLNHKEADAEDNSCNEREDSRNGIESPEDDSLNMSSKKKRGRPRKQVVDTPQGTEEHVLNHKEADAEDNSCNEKEDSRNGIESPEDDSLNISSKKKRGRPRKQVVDTPQSTEEHVLNHKEADAEDNSCNEREDSGNVIESPEDDSLNISSKKKRGRPRKQVVDTPQSTEEHVLNHKEAEANVKEGVLKDGEVVESNPVVRKRGRPRKLVTDTPSGVSEDEANVKEGELKDGEVVESNSAVRKRGRPRKLVTDTPSGVSEDEANVKEGGLKDGEVVESNPVVRKRGRPRKLVTDTPSGVSEDKTPRIRRSCTDTPSLSGKRKRTQNPKYVEDDSEPERSDDSLDTPTQPRVKRKRGRPPKSLKANEKDEVDHYDEDSDEEPEEDDDSDVEEEEEEKKGRRGRKRKQVIESSESDEEPTPKRKKRERKNSQKSGMPAAKKDSSKKCVLCEADCKDLAYLKRHMMIVHSLVYTKENPEGIQNSYLIVRLLGFIDCQRCHKRFRGGQYYNHHTKWCGREDEQAECEICKHHVKAMWLQQHLTAHRAAQKKLAMDKELEEERTRKKLEKSKEEAAEEKDGATGKPKRKAAKNALKHLSQVKEEGGNEGGSDGDSYKNSGDDTSESDDGDEGEDEDEDDDAIASDQLSDDGDSKRPNHGKGKISAKWSNLFRPTINQPLKSNLQRLQEYYSSQSQQPLFPELQPSRLDWTPLNSREKRRYLPDLARTVYFRTKCKGMASSKDKVEAEEVSEHSFHLGQTCSIEGNSVGSTGAPIWALEWCPLPHHSKADQVLAVAVDVMDGSYDSNKAVDGPGLVQLWSMGDVTQEQALSSLEDSKPAVSLRCCVAHDAGRVRSMAWCPSRQSEQNPIQATDGCPQRLGLLAIACSNGSVMVYSVPQVDSLPAAEPTDSDSSVPVIKPKPALTLGLNARPTYCGPCMSVAWQTGGESRYVAAGYAHGTVVLWDLQNKSPLMWKNESTLRPQRCFQMHSGPVVSLAWCSAVPNLLASSSLDFHMCLTDVDRPGTIHAEKRYLHRSFFRRLCEAGPLYLGFFGAEESLSVSTECGVKFAGLCHRSLGKKRDAQILINNNTATTWDVDFCPYSLIAVTCDANGKVKALLVDIVKLITDKGSRETDTNAMMASPAALVYQTWMDRDRIGESVATSESKKEASHQSGETGSAATQSEHSNLHTKSTLQNCDTVTQKITPVCSEGFALPKPVSKDSANCNWLDPGASKGSGQQNSTVGHNGSSGLEVSDFVTENTSVSSESIQTFPVSNGDRTLRNEGEIVNSATGLSTGKQCGTADTNGAVKSRVGGDIHVEPSGVSSSDIQTSCSRKTQESLRLNHHHHPDKAAPYTAETSSATSNTDLNQNMNESQKQGGLGESVSTDGIGTILFENSGKTAFEEETKTADEGRSVEDLTNFNNQLVSRVRLNPNPRCCAWLASGGQTGLLRLDDLSHMLRGHRPVVKKLRAKMNS